MLRYLNSCYIKLDGTMYALIAISPRRNLFDLVHQILSHWRYVRSCDSGTIQYIHRNILIGIIRISLQLPITNNKIIIINLIMMIIGTKFQPIVQL